MDSHGETTIFHWVYLAMMDYITKNYSYNSYVFHSFPMKIYPNCDFPRVKPPFCHGKPPYFPIKNGDVSQFSIVFCMFSHQKWWFSHPLRVRHPLPHPPCRALWQALFSSGKVTEPLRSLSKAWNGTSIDKLIFPNDLMYTVCLYETITMITILLSLLFPNDPCMVYLPT